MDLILERRKLGRFSIPGAKVKYTQEEGFKNSPIIEDTGDLIDLTLRAARFITKQHLNPGARLDLTLIIPDFETFTVRGNVVWTDLLDGEQVIHSVVEFIDFDKDPGYNLPENLEKLKILEEKYS
jgi:hypothetical protein